MLEILANRTYRHLFFAQVVALVGTDLATVALGLLAFDLTGANAGAVLGTALAIKMVAYIGIAPIASAFAERVPRRALLLALDLVRAAVALLLPFVTQIWQIYVLIFVLQSASAAFTPTFQATIPNANQGALSRNLRRRKTLGHDVCRGLAVLRAVATGATRLLSGAAAFALPGR